MVGSGVIGDGYNYRETVSRGSARSSCLQPQGELMAEAPLSFHIHALAGMALFMVWPFTRLVHAFSAPLGYLFRPVRGLPHSQHRGRRQQDATSGWDRTRSDPYTSGDAGIVPRRPAWKSSKAWISSALVFMTNGP